MIVAVIVFLAIIVGKSNDRNAGYGVLFEGLDASDNAAAIEFLKSKNIPYQLPNENTILVPRSEVYEQRIALSSAGIPKSSKIGFEIFDNQSFGTTDSEHQIKFLRAIEGELSRSMEALSPIKKANVILALPKSSVFVSEQIPPSASVVLTIKPGLALSSKQIFGIKNLVAAAVPRLDIDNVKIVNQNGEPLGENTELSASQEIAQTQLTYKRNIEQILESKIINILAPVVGGQHKVVARVTADFDFSQKKSLQEIYDPNNVVRSEQNLEEKKQGGSEQIGGVPGAVSNIGPVQGLDENTKELYEKTQNTTNYEVGKTINEVKGEFGSLRRISAAVVIDGKYRQDGENIEYVALNQDDINKIEALVKQAIGYNQNRGDSVSVSNFEFGLEPKPKDKVSQITDEIKSYLAPVTPFLKYIIALIVLFIFYRKIILPFMRKMLETQKEAPKKPEPLFENIDEQEDERMLNDMRRRIEDSLELSGFDESQVKYDVLLERTKGLIDERPEEVAALIKMLIKDEVEATK